MTHSPLTPTSGRHIQGDADVHIEVLGLDGEEDRAAAGQGVGQLGVVVTLHLSLRVEAVVAVHTHLTVAVVPLGGGAQEVLHTLGALGRDQDNVRTVGLRSGQRQGQ